MNHPTSGSCAAMRAALKRMLDAFYEDPLVSDQEGAVEDARAALSMAQRTNEWPRAFRDAQVDTYRTLDRTPGVMEGGNGR